LRSIENDVVDAYVCGTLEGELRERFESFYLASPLRRERVKFARGFLNAVDRLPDAATTMTSVVAVPAPAWPRRKFIWLGSAAGLLVACGLLLLRDVRLQRGLFDAQHDGAALGQRGRELARQLGDERIANDALRKEVERLRAEQPLALVLRPQTRAALSVPVIAVPRELDAVAFELELEASDFSQYQVALKDPATNRIAWRSGFITAESSRRPPAVGVRVPASLLRPQHYALELSGRKPGAPFDAVGSYAFQVEAQ
jgi:hypothetical protein